MISEKILSAIKNPISLLALMVLVSESILFILSKRVTGTNLTIIIIGMVVVIPLVLLLLYLKPINVYHDDLQTINENEI
jgi:hypothetical protein